MDSVFSSRKGKKINKHKLIQNEKLESVLFVKGRKREKFLTNDSYLYFDCNDENAAKTIEFRTKNKLFDSLNHKIVREYNNVRGNRGDYLYEQYYAFAHKLKKYQEEIADRKHLFINNISIFRLWNASILTAIIIGMISMSFIYRYLGSGVLAEDSTIDKAVAGVSQTIEEDVWTKEREDQYIADLEAYLQIEAKKDFNIKVRELVKGYPIEDFLPYLLDKDHKVVAFYIAIAKKESNWGKRVPVLDGKDCFNYVGYRGGGDRLGSGGHSCFIDRKEAVEVVSKRLKQLIEEYDRDTAARMVVWKCGNDCNATGGQAAANKWIADVDMILAKLNESD